MKTVLSNPSVSVWRVVIIEDSSEDRDEIRRLLLQGSERRYQFVEAETGAAGVRAILDPSTGPPDCVVLDYTLPDTDAMDVLAAVMGSNELAVCPVVVLTGTAGPQFGPAVLRSGAQDFIGKGWMTAESLTRAVENAAERWAMFRELQARKAALEASEAQLQLAVEVAGLGVIRIDYATNTVVLDSLAAALFGLKAGVTLPRSVIHGTFHPDDKVEIFRLMNRSLDPRGDGWFVMEHRVVHPDGSIHWLSVKKQVVFGDVDCVRRPETGVLAAVDITERKRQQQEIEDSRRTLHAVIDRCPFGIYIVDADFRFASVNARSETVAFATIRPVVGRLFDEAMRIIWPESTANEIIHAFRHSLDTGEPYRSKDFVHRRADIERTEGYEWELHRVAMPDGRPGVVCYYYDSTQLRRVEQQLKDADRTKDEFLATLAHELRNPLAPIRNSLELLKWESGNVDLRKQACETMERQIGHMVRLIDDLLDVSRISRDKLVLKKERLELSSAIHHAVEACQSYFDRDNHEFVLTLPPEPIHLLGDPTRFAQVIGNLLTNASKYSESGGKIWLTVERQVGEVEIVVQDRGIGIPPEMLEKVFDMFTQIDKSLERSDGGLGIGLSLVKRLVELHGGTVTAHSDGLGHGSEFTVRLPIEIEQTRIESSVQASSPVQSKSNGRRILVVDDNRDNATSLALLLRITGNETKTAFDGLAAIEMAEKFRPEVILLDIGLPKMNGHDACRAIRNQPWGKDILILALTGWGQEEDRRKTAEAGFNNHLVKPVDHIALKKLISEFEPSDLS